MRNLKSGGGTSTLTAAQVRTQVDAGNVAYDASTGTELATTESKVDTINDIADELLVEADHVTHIFPEDTDETVAFTAHGSNDTWSTWAEIADNNAVTLSSKVGIGMHISSCQIEDSSQKDSRYMLELAYGDGKIIITRQRFMSGNVKLGTVQQMRVRATKIPTGETVYYRLKCETGGASMEVSFRYHPQA